LGSAFIDFDFFTSSEVEGEVDGIDLMIPTVEEAFLEVSNIAESVGVFLAAVFEIEAFGEEFCTGCSHFFEMDNSKYQPDSKNHRPNQSAFSVLEIIVEAKVIDTLDSRIDSSS
jgi:hypothetical protein